MSTILPARESSAATVRTPLRRLATGSAAAPERDPPFERWGITIRLVSLVLVVAVVGLIVTDRLARRS